jgi:hypothetical protein
MSGRECPLCPGTSDVDLLRYRDGIIHLDAKISDRAFDPGVTEQELDGTQVPGTSVDQRRLRPPQRMGTEQLRIEPDAGDPPGDKPCILARRHAPADHAAAHERKFARLLARSS